MATKELTRKRNLYLGKLKPKWWTKPADSEFDPKERKRRRQKNKQARAARKANR